MTACRETPTPTSAGARPCSPKEHRDESTARTPREMGPDPRVDLGGPGRARDHGPGPDRRVRRLRLWRPWLWGLCLSRLWLWKLRLSRLWLWGLRLRRPRRSGFRLWI